MSQNQSTAVLPFLTVKNGKQALSFYTDAFGATVVQQHQSPDGRVTADIEIAGAPFYVGDEEPEFGNLGPNRTANNPVRIILRTHNADALFEQAIKCGAIQICPMTTEAAWRIGKLTDPFGHVWEIGYPLES